MPDFNAFDELRPRFTNAKHAAIYLGVSVHRMYQLLDQGLIKSQYEGTRRLIDIKSLEAYADSLPSVHPDAR